MPSLHAPLAHAAGLEAVAEQLAAVLAAAEDPLQLISITGPPGIGALARRTMIVYGMAHAMVEQSGDLIDGLERFIPGKHSAGRIGPEPLSKSRVMLIRSVILHAAQGRQPRRLPWPGSLWRKGSGQARTTQTWPPARYLLRRHISSVA